MIECINYFLGLVSRVINFLFNLVLFDNITLGIFLLFFVALGFSLYIIFSVINGKDG